MKWKLVLLACTLLGAMNLVTSLPVSAQLYWNNAAAFNGASRVSFQNATAINLTGSFTVEAWVNPSQAQTTRAGLIAKAGTSAIRQYALSLNTSGRLELGANAGTRLTSKTTSVIQNNLWTHVAGTYNSATNLFSIYINGALDTTTTVPSAAPSSGTDSLYIGYDAGSGGYFSGMIDEARVWNRALSEAEISRNLRTSLTASGGAYDGLIVSVPFQGAAISTDFTVLDQSVSGFDAVNNGAVSVDFGNRPPTYLSWNESAEFDGTGDYLAAANSNAVSPTAAYTLEAWIYPRSFDNSPTIIGKNFQSGFWLGIDSTASTGKIVLFIPKGGAVPSFTSLPLTNQ